MWGGSNQGLMGWASGHVQAVNHGLASSYSVQGEGKGQPQTNSLASQTEDGKQVS